MIFGYDLKARIASQLGKALNPERISQGFFLSLQEDNSRAHRQNFCWDPSFCLVLDKPLVKMLIA